MSRSISVDLDGGGRITLSDHVSGEPKGCEMAISTVGLDQLRYNGLYLSEQNLMALLEWIYTRKATHTLAKRNKHVVHQRFLGLEKAICHEDRATRFSLERDQVTCKRCLHLGREV